MKKVLIWDISFRLANKGGPAGYLYNIHEYLHSHQCEQIVFLSDLYPKRKTNHAEQTSSVKQRLLEAIKTNRFIYRINDLLYIIWKQYHTCNVRLPEGMNLNEYDFVHFHQVNDVRRYASLLKNTGCKTILTTHCPCPMTDEQLAGHPWYYRLFAPWLRWQERQCYKNADYLLFPCKEAREPYEKDIQIRKLFHALEHKFVYCPSAIQDVIIDENKMQRFSDFGIPKDAFVITYFGRHNAIKGYDILKQIGERLLPKYPNLYFLCAGKGEIEPLRHPRWIELGFISNTAELLQQSDLYILPNRETYFDLIVLEVLRSATPIILAENGGNKSFLHLSQEERTGMSFCRTGAVEEYCLQAERHIKMQTDNRFHYASLGQKNRTLWEKQYSMSRYVSGYQSIIDSLCYKREY